MTAGHTPGPWGPIGIYDPCNIFGGDGRRLVAATGGYQDSAVDTLAENKANARLIAAAPDLLAACADARDALLNETGNPLALMAALVTLDAAIAKATGAAA